MAQPLKRIFAGLFKMQSRRFYSPLSREARHGYPKACLQPGYRSASIGTWLRQDTRRTAPLLAVSVTGFVSWLLDLESESEAIEDKLILTMKKAVLAQRRTNYGESEKIFHDAFEILVARHKNGELSDEEFGRIRIILFSYLSNLALEAGQLRKAENLFKDTIKLILTVGYATDDNSVVEISLKLATIYASLERHSEAVAGYKFCIETQEKKVSESKGECADDTLALYGMCLSGYGRYCLLQKRLDEARRNYEKSLAISESVLGPEHDQNLVIMSDLAVVCCELNDFASAKSLLEKAIQVASSTGSNSLPTYMCNLAAVCLQMGELNQSKIVCDRTVRVATELDDKDALKKAQFCLEEIRKRQAGNGSK